MEQLLEKLEQIKGTAVDGNYIAALTLAFSIKYDIENCRGYTRSFTHQAYGESKAYATILYCNKLITKQEYDTVIEFYHNLLF